MRGLLAGKKCLVLGVANRWSIAWGVAQAFHEEGADLFFTYSRERSGQNLAALLDAWPGGPGIPRQRCDVGDDDQIAGLFRRVAEHWAGRLDVLVHSIAHSRPEDLAGRYVDISRDGYAFAHGISAYSLIPCAKHAAPLFAASGGGSVVAMSYIAGQRVAPGYGVMASAKAALECHVRYLAAELGPGHIRVNAISAGPIRTRAASGVKGVRHLREVAGQRAPLRRNVTQREVGDVAVFLASPLSRSVTGEVLYADHGLHLLGVAP
jgi:enoyl-[acyl-carrier protein] reductase I